MHYTEEQKKALLVIYEKIKGISTVMLTTRDRATGHLHSRPMAAIETAPDGTLWFFTYSNAEKADEVMHHPEVNICYTDVSNHRFISISGEAEMAVDRQKMESLWKPELKSWFPEGLDNSKMALLKVKIKEAEYWDSSKSRMHKLLDYTKTLLHVNANGQVKHEKVDLGKAY
jgi:general stress protein 26